MVTGKLQSAPLRKNINTQIPYTYMGQTPFNNPLIALEWAELAKTYQAQDISVNDIYNHIAEKYGCSPSTVRYHLDKKHSNRIKQLGRLYRYRRSRARSIDDLDNDFDIKIDEYLSPKKQNSNLKTLSIEDIVAQRNYCKHRIRLTRHPERYIPLIFGTHKELDIYTATFEIRKLVEGISFDHSMIERLLRKYETGQREGRIRGPPFLTEFEPGKWRYSNENPTTAPSCSYARAKV